MVDIFCIIEILLMFLYGCIAYKMKKADKVLEKNHPDISWAKLCQWMNSLTEKETALTIRPGKLYGYNPRKKELLFIEKDRYSLYDVFGIYHELGHYHDDLKSNVILKHMSITGVNRLVLIPLFIILTVVCWFINEDSAFIHVYLVLSVLCILLGLHRLYFICKYEASASRDAVRNMSEFCEEPDIKEIRRAAFYAMISQLVFVLVILIFGLNMTYCTIFW